MMTHRPCGACARLIPVDTGCLHWRPNGQALSRGQRYRAGKRERERLTTKEAVAELSRALGGKSW